MLTISTKHVLKLILHTQIRHLEDVVGSYIMHRETVVVKPEDKLGEGVFGAVYKGIFYGAPVAVKELKDNCRENCTQFEEEMKMGASCHHPNVVHVYGVILEGKPSIVMERLDLNLHEFICKSDISRLNEHFKCLALGIAKGLVYLHSKKPPVIHSDLHLGNVLLKQVGEDKYEAKIGDLGSARCASPESKSSDQQAPKVSFFPLLFFNSMVHLEKNH